VVKCFNTVNARPMAHPEIAADHPDMLIAGNDSAAKQTVSAIAEGWGWTVRDVGGIERSYLLEALALLWIVYGFRSNHWTHVFKLMNTE
jgi:8-hydroxy-5-deazaflavin:NADPH oxidoreductase